ncbi:hypothetical protein [Acidithiobacillus sp.]|uniref:hypothetical protein n=1 Tax=Acidithiobacillus sp. TaxID=1872118 RepID=UPI003CFFB3BC
MSRKMMRTVIGAGLVLGVWAWAPVMAAESAGGHAFPAMQLTAFDNGAIVSNAALRQARGGELVVPSLAASARQMPVVMLWDELPMPAASSNTQGTGGGSRGNIQGGVRSGAPQPLVPVLPNLQNLPASVMQSSGSFSGN